MTPHLYRGTIAYDEPLCEPHYHQPQSVRRKADAGPLPEAQRKALWRAKNIDHVRAQNAFYQRAHRARLREAKEQMT
jgi:hypothetical protein